MAKVLKFFFSRSPNNRCVTTGTFLSPNTARVQVVHTREKYFVGAGIPPQLCYTCTLGASMPDEGMNKNKFSPMTMKNRRI